MYPAPVTTADADQTVGARASVERLVRVFVFVALEHFFGVVVGVGAGLAVIQVGGGIHSVVPSWRLRVVQPSCLTSRLCGPQLKVRLSMSVSPPLAQSVLAWCAWHQ